MVERYGVSTATARALGAPRCEACGHCRISSGRCVPGISASTRSGWWPTWATPETDPELSDLSRQAAFGARSCRRCTLDRLRLTEPLSPLRSDHNQRRFLRFNDQHRTVTVQLPPEESYAERLPGVSRRQGLAESPLMARRPGTNVAADAFMEKIRSSAGADGMATATRAFFGAVVHVPLAALVENSGESTNLAGDLERDGLIDRTTVQRISL